MKSKLIPTVAVVLAFGAGIVMHVATSHATPATISGVNREVTMEPKTEPLPSTAPEPTPASGSNPFVSPSPSAVTNVADSAPTPAIVPGVGSDVSVPPKPSPVPSPDLPDQRGVGGHPVVTY